MKNIILVSILLVFCFYRLITTISDKKKLSMDAFDVGYYMGRKSAILSITNKEQIIFSQTYLDDQHKKDSIYFSKIVFK